MGMPWSMSMATSRGNPITLLRFDVPAKGGRWQVVGSTPSKSIVLKMRALYVMPPLSNRANVMGAKGIVLLQNETEPNECSAKGQHCPSGRSPKRLER